MVIVQKNPIAGIKLKVSFDSYKVQQRMPMEDLDKSSTLA